MDAVIEIVPWVDKNGVTLCARKCWASADLCEMAKKNGMLYSPTEACPGPGRWRLVKVEEE